MVPSAFTALTYRFFSKAIFTQLVNLLFLVLVYFAHRVAWCTKARILARDSVNGTMGVIYARQFGLKSSWFDISQNLVS